MQANCTRALLFSLLPACPQRSKSVDQVRANTKVRPGLTSGSV